MKRIVICADGTWNRPDQTAPTNVVKFARAVAPSDRDGTPQVVFYDLGVGTGNVWDRITGGAFGKEVEQNIADGYRFLVHNYAEGDAIHLIGFSRGAFTVRSLAGLLRNVGLLQTVHSDRFPEAYAMYRSPDRPDSPEAEAFRAAYSRVVRIHFLGVWDTVGALGIPITGLQRITRSRHQFHDLRLSRSVANAFQQDDQVKEQLDTTQLPQNGRRVAGGQRRA